MTPRAVVLIAKLRQRITLRRLLLEQGINWLDLSPQERRWLFIGRPGR